MIETLAFGITLTLTMIGWVLYASLKLSHPGKVTDENIHLVLNQANKLMNLRLGALILYITGLTGLLIVAIMGDHTWGTVITSILLVFGVVELFSVRFKRRKFRELYAVMRFTQG